MNSEQYMKEVFEKIDKEDLQVPEEKNETSQMIWEILFTIVFAILTLFILGIYELFSSGWDWTIYTSPDFWIRYGLLQGASWFARVWIYIIRVKHHERTDTTFIKLENELQLFIDADFETPFIESEANLDNFNRKKRAWLNKQKRKIIKIANKYHITNILPYVKDVNTTELSMHGFLLKSDKRMYNFTEKRVNRRVTNILKTLRDDWCESNLDAVKVKYNKVSRTILTSGYVSNRSSDGTPDYKQNGGKEFFRSTIPAFLFVSIFMFLIVPLTGDINNSADAWFKFLTNFMLVLASGAMMWYNSKDLFKKTSLKALAERVSTTNNYARKRDIKVTRK